MRAWNNEMHNIEIQMGTVYMFKKLISPSMQPWVWHWVYVAYAFTPKIECVRYPLQSTLIAIDENFSFFLSGKVEALCLRAEVFAMYLKGNLFLMNLSTRACCKPNESSWEQGVKNIVADFGASGSDEIFWLYGSNSADRDNYTVEQEELIKRQTNGSWLTPGLKHDHMVQIRIGPL